MPAGSHERRTCKVQGGRGRCNSEESNSTVFTHRRCGLCSQIFGIQACFSKLRCNVLSIYRFPMQMAFLCAQECATREAMAQAAFTSDEPSRDLQALVSQLHILVNAVLCSNVLSSTVQYCVVIPTG